MTKCELDQLVWLWSQTSILQPYTEFALQEKLANEDESLYQRISSHCAWIRNETYLKQKKERGE